jgi:serine/threonine protein kinase
MAPEQLISAQCECDARVRSRTSHRCTHTDSKKTDVFSFGVLLFEIMSGQPPWSDVGNTAAAHLVLSGDRVPVPARAPPHYGTLMTHCFVTDVSERPSLRHGVRDWFFVLACWSSYNGRSHRGARSRMRVVWPRRR